MGWIGAWLRALVWRSPYKGGPCLFPCLPAAGLGPGPAPQAGPPLRRLLHPPAGALLQPGGQPLPQPRAPLFAVPRASAAVPGAPGPPGPGHGAEPARGLVGGLPGWTQRRARAQLHALDPGPGGLGEPPRPLWASLYPTVTAGRALPRFPFTHLPLCSWSACCTPGSGISAVL